MAQKMLGCCTYEIGVRDRSGTPLGMLSGVESLAWDRRLDDISVATMNVAVAGADADCCEILSQMRTWRHDVSIFRCGEEVWRGPIVQIEYDAEGATIIGNDVLAWLRRRVIHNDHDYTGRNKLDLSFIAQNLITDAIDVDDPGFLKFLHIIASGIIGERSYTKNESYAMAALRDLADGGIDYTTVLSRIIVGPQDSFGHLGNWGDSFFPNGYKVVESGLDAANRGILRGGQEGEGGIFELEYDATLDAHREYYGLLEDLTIDSTILDESSGEEILRKKIESVSIPPLVIQMNDDTLLDPKAPVDINELIPGVTVNFFSELTCRSVKQVLRLNRLFVTDDVDNGEQVRTSFAPVGPAETGFAL